MGFLKALKGSKKFLQVVFTIFWWCMSFIHLVIALQIDSASHASEAPVSWIWPSHPSIPSCQADTIVSFDYGIYERLRRINNAYGLGTNRSIVSYTVWRPTVKTRCSLERLDMAWFGCWILDGRNRFR